MRSDNGGQLSTNLNESSDSNIWKTSSNRRISRLSDPTDDEDLRINLKKTLLDKKSAKIIKNKLKEINNDGNPCILYMFLLCNFMLFLASLVVLAYSLMLIFDFGFNANYIVISNLTCGTTVFILSTGSFWLRRSMQRLRCYMIVFSLCLVVMFVYDLIIMINKTFIDTIFME